MLGFGALGELALGEIPAAASSASSSSSDAESSRRGHKAMYPGGWIPQNLFIPPRKKIKQSTVKALKELYEEAREEIPEQLQTGLISPDLLVRARATSTLPPPAMVDFEKLARSLETIRVLVAALNEARKRAKAEADKVRRHKEEQFLIQMLEDLD